jgi:hypothetical protein
MSLYDTDSYAWAEQQVRLLRAGQLAQADVEHIAAESRTQRAVYVPRRKSLDGL